MGREGFEPPKAKPADLQSAPFDRSGTCALQCRDHKVNHYLETDKYVVEKILAPNRKKRAINEVSNKNCSEISNIIPYFRSSSSTESNYQSILSGLGPWLRKEPASL